MNWVWDSLYWDLLYITIIILLCACIEVDGMKNVHIFLKHLHFILLSSPLITQAHKIPFPFPRLRFHSCSIHMMFSHCLFLHFMIFFFCFKRQLRVFNFTDELDLVIAREVMQCNPFQYANGEKKWLQVVDNLKRDDDRLSTITPRIIKKRIRFLVDKFLAVTHGK